MRTKIIIFLLCAIALYFQPGPFWSSHWWTRYHVILIVMSALVAVMAAKRTSLFFLPFFLIALCGSAIISQWSTHPEIAWLFSDSYLANEYAMTYGPAGSAIQSSGHALMFALSGLLLAMTAPQSWKPNLYFVLRVIWFLSCVVTMIQSTGQAHIRGAFVGNPSMNGCLIAILFPMAMTAFSNNAQKIFVFFATAFCVISVKSSIPIAVFVLVLLVYFRREKQWLALIPASIVVAFLSGPNFFSDSGRFNVWALSMTWWREHINPWFGSGFGTGISFIQIAQRNANTNPTEFDAFWWLHSDWLQILWETGIIGLVSAILGFISITIKLRRRPELQSMWLGFGATAVFNYPLHQPIHNVVFFILLYLVISIGGAGSNRTLTC